MDWIIKPLFSAHRIILSTPQICYIHLFGVEYQSLRYIRPQDLSPDIRHQTPSVKSSAIYLVSAIHLLLEEINPRLWNNTQVWSPPRLELSSSLLGTVLPRSILRCNFFGGWFLDQKTTLNIRLGTAAQYCCSLWCCLQTQTHSTTGHNSLVLQVLDFVAWQLMSDGNVL